MITEAMRAPYEAFVREIIDRLERKMPLALARASGLDFIPYTVKDGSWAV